MIELVGTSHDHVTRQYIEKIIERERFDHLFVEGANSSTLSDIEHLFKNNSPKLSKQVPLKIHQRWNSGFNRGPEPRYVEDLIEQQGYQHLQEKEVTFLDDDPVEYGDVLLTENNEGKQAKDVSKLSYEEFKKKLEQGVERNDFTKYFRNIGEFSSNIKSVSLSNPRKFTYFLKEVSTDFSDVIDENGNSGDDLFIDAALDFDIDRFDLQHAIYDLRKDFQDDRDQRWHAKISDYLDENPGEEILVMAGMNHMIEGDNSVRGLLEEDYEEVEVHPMDFYQ